MLPARGALIWLCRTTARSEIVTWIRCHGSVCFGMWNCRLLPEFPACAGQTALMDQGSVLLCRENWGKKCPLPEAWASVPHGLCWGATSSCLPSWRGIGNPCCAWRVCSVTCTDVFLFHNNHFTSCLENGAFWLCACVDQCSCLRAGPGG